MVIGCPAASLRSVNVRPHRNRTRGIIEVFSGKIYWTFVVHAGSIFTIARARKLDIPRVCQPDLSVFMIEGAVDRRA